MTTVSEKVLIQNLKGLHARATAAFVKVASTFESEIRLSRTGETFVSGKSIMGILMLAVPIGEEITITATGTDAQEAIKALTDLVNARFNEE